METIYGVFNH